MMTMRILSLMVLGAMALVGCESGDKRVVATADSSAISSIVGDKSMMADAIRSAHQRGTLDDALVLAMKDSALADEVIDALMDDPRLKERFLLVDNLDTSVGKSTAKARAVASTPKRTATVARRQSGGAVASRSSGDVLDKAERTGQQVNEKLDQAERVKRQAEEAKRKIDGIFGR